jgi:hypothetical protein
VPVIARLNHKGDLAARGDCTVTGHRITLARPIDEVEEVSIVTTDLLDGATVSSRTIENNGCTVTPKSHGRYHRATTNRSYAPARGVQQRPIPLPESA